MLGALHLPGQHLGQPSPVVESRHGIGYAISIQFILELLVLGKNPIGSVQTLGDQEQQIGCQG